MKFEGEYINGKMYEGKIYDNKLKKIMELKHGKGVIKEYNDYCSFIIFEGENLNGKRNGKGKEYYYNNKIKFDGEYSYGRRWNGNMYDINGNLLFEIKNGIGNGKEYDINFKLEYEGGYLDGKRNGQGKEFRNNRLIFEGEYFNGERNGKGKEYYTISEIKKLQNY